MDSKGAFGVIVVFFGLTQALGALTGQEAPMLAALFKPDLLATKAGSPAVPQLSQIVKAGLNK